MGVKRQRLPFYRCVRPPTVALVLTIALLAVTSPIGLVGPTEATVRTASGLSHSPVALLPAALSIPWTERAGYQPGLLPALRSPTPSAGSVTVVITLAPRDPALFVASPAVAHSPSLSTGDIAGRYGLSPAAYAALERYFEARGLVVAHAWPDRLHLTLQGPAGRVGAAFGTKLVTGTLSGRAARLPLYPPRLPGPFDDEVAALGGLSSGTAFFSLPFGRMAPAPEALGPDRTTNFVTPSAAHALYGLDGLYNYTGSPHWATSQGIVLLLWGDGFDPADLKTFFARFYPAGFPAPKVTAYPIDGAPFPSAGALGDPSNAPQELTLDIEWAGATAPGATLDAVYAPDGPASDNYSPTDAAMEDALAAAINSVPGATAVSMSFGTPDGSDPSFQAAFTTDFAEAQKRGITLFGASGDNGGRQQSHGACTTIPSPQFPASSPYVIAVGGTNPALSLSPLGAVTGLASESAWNLSGGGYSSQYPAASWQTVGTAAPLIAANGGMRGIPDVAGPAAANFFYYGGSQAEGQGTSFATPFWAGLVAEMNAVRGTPFGFLTPRLYAVGVGEASGKTAVGLADITTGGTCIGPATAGWDPETGWGSPRALLLYEDLSATYVTVNLTANPGTVDPGQTVHASVVIRNATSRGALMGLPVNLTLSAASDYVGPCGGLMAKGSGRTDANGSVSVALPVSSCFLGSTVTVSAEVLADGFFGGNATTVGVNLLSFSGFVALLQQFPYNLIALLLVAAGVIALAARVGRRRRARRMAFAMQSPAVEPAPPAASPAPPPGLPPNPPY